MITEKHEAQEEDDLELSDQATEFLWDFQRSPQYYYHWLMYANDLLLEEAMKNEKDCSKPVQCLYALKNIRDLLVAMQDKAIFDIERERI